MFVGLAWLVGLFRRAYELARWFLDTQPEDLNWPEVDEELANGY